MHVHSGPSPAGHLGERGGESRGTEVLERLDEALLDELEAGLDHLLAGERIADLDGRPLVLVGVGELLARQHAGAADSVAAGRGAVEDDQVARPRRLGPSDALGREEPDAHRVHERVLGVRLVEDRVATDGRHADRVPVGADPGDGAVEGVVGRSEAKPVQERYRPGSHRHDVPEDAPDARRRALERLDRGRMVVALHLEGGRFAVSEVDHARVLAGPLKDRSSLRRKAAEEECRVLVAAVLRPEEGKDSELELVRVALEQIADSLELPVRQAESTVERRLFGDRSQSPTLAFLADGRSTPHEASREASSAR